MTVLEALKGARERITKPENWCKMAASHVCDDGTVQYCAAGSIRAQGEFCYGAILRMATF